MSTPRTARKRPVGIARPTTRGPYLVSLAAAVGLALTLLLNVVPSLEPAYQNRALHVAKETAGGLVLLLVAALMLGRFRRAGRLFDLLALAAVAVIAGKNLVFSVLSAILTETSGGLTTWRTTGVGMLGAALLAIAAFSPERVVADRRRALFITGGACVVLLGLLIGFSGIFNTPAAFTDPPETTADLRRLSQDSELLVADLAASALFLLAGWVLARRAEREGDELQVWLGVGSTIAGIAYLNYALYPSSFTDFLYTGDFFRIAAIVAWGIGTVRVISAYQSAAEETAVLDERRRVARDLHDGVAQELSFISSQMHWLTSEVEEERPSAELRDLTGRIMESVQRALDESRGAISALSRPVHEPLYVTLAYAAEEVAGRLGARLELDLDDRVAVSPAWEEALTRILREAVTNAVRHGKAPTVNVLLRDVDGILLRVTDDGLGFDVSEPASNAHFGLTSMRERTEALGGEFKLSSQPGRGTSVEVLLPS